MTTVRAVAVHSPWLDTRCTMGTGDTPLDAARRFGS
jgi:hypothetical protein